MTSKFDVNLFYSYTDVKFIVKNTHVFLVGWGPLNFLFGMARNDARRDFRNTQLSNFKWL